MDTQTTPLFSGSSSLHRDIRLQKRCRGSVTLINSNHRKGSMATVLANPNIQPQILKECLASGECLYFSPRNVVMFFSINLSILNMCNSTCALEIFWICNQEWCKIKHMRKSLKYSEFATKSDARSNTWENLCIQMWSGSHPHKLKSLPSTLITIAHMEIGATVQELKISITQKKGLKQKSNTSVQEALFFFLSKSDFGFLPVVTFFCWLVYNEGTTISVLTSTKEQKHVILNTINTHIIEQFTDRFLPQLKSKQKQTKNLYRLNQLITQAILKQSDAQQKGISFWQRSMVIHKQILFQ